MRKSANQTFDGTNRFRLCLLRFSRNFTRTLNSYSTLWDIGGGFDATLFDTNIGSGFANFTNTLNNCFILLDIGSGFDATLLDIGSGLGLFDIGLNAFCLDIGSHAALLDISSGLGLFDISAGLNAFLFDISVGLNLFPCDLSLHLCAVRDDFLCFFGIFFQPFHSIPEFLKGCFETFCFACPDSIIVFIRGNHVTCPTKVAQYYLK